MHRGYGTTWASVCTCVPRSMFDSSVFMCERMWLHLPLVVLIRLLWGRCVLITEGRFTRAAIVFNMKSMTEATKTVLYMIYLYMMYRSPCTFSCWHVLTSKNIKRTSLTKQKPTLNPALLTSILACSFLLHCLCYSHGTLPPHVDWWNCVKPLTVCILHVLVSVHNTKGTNS